MDTYCITPDQRIPSLQWKIFVDPDGVCLRGGPLAVSKSSMYKYSGSVSTSCVYDTCMSHVRIVSITVLL